MRLRLHTTPSAERASKRVSRLRDDAGATLMMALVFFLICALVGTTVITAASINAKAVVTRQESKQAELTVTSAADMMASQFEGTVIEWNYDQGEGMAPSPVFASSSDFSKKLWTQYAANFWSAKTTGAAYTVGGDSASRLTLDINGYDPVYSSISVDRDFTIEIRLSSERSMAASAAYDVTVRIPCVTTFSNTGVVMKSSWEEATITKTNTAVQAGGA